MSILLVVAALASMALTWAARAYALRRQLVDEPGERRSHMTPTPRGGGVGPVVVFIALIVVAGVRGLIPEVSWPWLAGALGLVGGIGSWDDHRPLGAGVRLAVHVVAGVMVTLAFGLWTSPLLAFAMAFACVAMINVWNFMDGIDGIAATQTAIVAGGAFLLGDPGWSWLAAGLVACTLGFLPMNFPRARIFLGDVGSGALGLSIATLGISALAEGTRPERATIFLIPAAPFMVDSGLTLARRVLRGERWWTAHTQHLFQGLARRYGHPPVTAAYAAWSMAGLLVGQVLTTRAPAVTVVCVVLWYTASAAVWAWGQQFIRRDDGLMRNMDR